MNFVDSLKLFGVEAKQIPTIILHGAPSESTEGAVGVLGMDVLLYRTAHHACQPFRHHRSSGHGVLLPFRHTSAQ